MIIVGLSVAGLLPGLESTIVTTYLPTITAELSIGDNYVWIANVFSLTRWDGFSNLKRPVRQVVNKLHPILPPFAALPSNPSLVKSPTFLAEDGSQSPL